jgi:hypothetical protein
MKTSNSSLLRLRAVFCAVVALLALPSVSRATTTTVTYAGTEYDISFYLGTYNTAPSGVTLSTQPWFGSATVAADFRFASSLLGAGSATVAWPRAGAPQASQVTATQAANRHTALLATGDVIEATPRWGSRVR